MARPVIGITGYHERTRWDMWDCPATVIQQSYIDSVSGHGARVVVLPPDSVDSDVLLRLDGLLLTSGADVDPSWYDQARHPATEPPRPDRDEGESLLARRALALDLPLLGVCRGMQLLVVVTGGTLHQHLPDVVGHDGHGPAGPELAKHDVRFTRDSLAADVFGRDRVVNSHHHQGVADPGELRVTGYAADGVAEAVEHPAKSFALGVQWHPEVSGDAELFAAFVTACSTRMAYYTERVQYDKIDSGMPIIGQ